jgi:hypothetical protein
MHKRTAKSRAGARTHMKTIHCEIHAIFELESILICTKSNKSKCVLDYWDLDWAYPQIQIHQFSTEPIIISMSNSQK